ncbi:galactose mutarotase [Thalassotalea sp. M1531]|uniref:Aldose 1-epimerase n=1 Tax=Thalassotalea algicola TaxID=2716224 RepID=A0A7Y0L9Q9_9GAMM|nr:aldose epimerase family protein [Thalassotalea algicola]NMP30072.1 galactose mutarotase [Thalassotalea algicola]
MELRSFVLCNASGDEVCISNYGARLLQWHTQVGNEDRNIILGYSSLSEYLDDPFYHGAIAGPFANRIGGASFSIDNNEFKLQANEGKNHLHGGDKSISDQFWEIVAQEEQVITLKCELEDGFNGYPGAMNFWVTYHLNNDSSLDIDIKVTTEQATVVGPTTHPYFNLAGIESEASGHILQIFAENYTEIDSASIPTGEIVPVDGTPLDFRQPRRLDPKQSKDNLDHNFVVSRSAEESQAILISPDKKLQLHVSSGYPGLQVYTGKHLSGKFESSSGICLEPQFYPNSPNVDNFPFYLTTPEEPFSMRISYKLVKMVQQEETE